MNERLIHLIATRQATPRDLEGIPAEEVRAIKSNPDIAQVSVKSSTASVVSEDTRTLRYVWTDESVDSDGDIITLSGWDLTRFVQNPVFLWGHDGRSVPPIGKAVSIQMEPHAKTPRALVDVEYAPKDAFEFADTIYQLAKRGFVNATSAGFRVLEIAQLTDKQRQDMGIGMFGIKSLKQQLYEISNVSMPANENALRAELKTMVDKGVLDDGVRRNFEKTFPLTEKDLQARLKEIRRAFIDLGAVKPKDATMTVSTPAGDTAPVVEIEPVYSMCCEGYLVNGVFQPDLPDASAGMTQMAARSGSTKAVLEAATKLIEASAKTAETNNRLVSAISDLTKRIAVMGDNAGGAKAPEAAPSEARGKQAPVTEKSPPPATSAVDSVKAAADQLVASVTAAIAKKNS